MALRLALKDHEHDLLVLALQRWRWNIADDSSSGKLTFFDAGQQQACRYTTKRIDEMLVRLDWLKHPPETEP